MPFPLIRALALALLVAAPAGAQTMTGSVTQPAAPNFTVEGYMGQWYEIARLDHPFERGLVRVTSTRAQRPDGGFDVVNRGVDKASGQVREARATARLLETAGSPTLEIDYGPGGKHTYDILETAQDNQYALVGSTDRSSLWIFSRQPKLDPSVVERLKARALSAGYQTDRMIMVEQGS